MMNAVDYLILGILAVSALVGLIRGLVREVLSLGIWVAALLVAWLFHRDVADLLTTQLSMPSARLAVAFVGLILLSLFVGALLGSLLTTLVDKAGLTGLDRLLGLGFGAARGAVIVAIAVFLAALTPLPDDPWWRESQLIGQFQHLGNWLLTQVPEELQARIRSI